MSSQNPQRRDINGYVALLVLFVVWGACKIVADFNVLMGGGDGTILETIFENVFIWGLIVLGQSILLGSIPGIIAILLILLVLFPDLFHRRH